MQDATEGIIAFPAGDPEMLAKSLLRGLDAPEHPTWGGLRRSNSPGQAGVSVSTFSSTVTESGQRVSFFISGWDIEASTARFSRPKELSVGAWVSISSDVRGPGAVDVMTALAKRLGGFLQFKKERTLRDGGTVVGPWISPTEANVMAGLDTSKHRLMRALGAEAAPVIEKILRSEGAMDTVIGVLEVEKVMQGAAQEHQNRTGP